MPDYNKELARTDASAPKPYTPAAEVLVPTNEKLVRQIGTVAIAIWAAGGLSVLNIFIARMEAPIRMVYAFFTTELVFAIGQAIGPIAQTIALGMIGLFLGFTIFLGFQVKAKRTWAIYFTMALFILDLVPLFYMGLAGLWPIGLHLYVAYQTVLGLKAAKVYNERKKNGQAA